MGVRCTTQGRAQNLQTLNCLSSAPRSCVCYPEVLISELVWSYSGGGCKIYIHRNCSSLCIYMSNSEGKLHFKPRPIYVKINCLLPGHTYTFKNQMKFSRFALLHQVMVAYVPNEILQPKVISVLGSMMLRIVFLCLWVVTT